MRREQTLQPRGDRASTWALALGIASFAGAFVPAIGEFIAAPAALAAIVLGLIGLRRYETYRVSRAAPAAAGVIMGTIALLVVAFVLLATGF